MTETNKFQDFQNYNYIYLIVITIIEFNIFKKFSETETDKLQDFQNYNYI